MTNTNCAACQDGDGINFNDIASTVASKGQANVGSIDLFSEYLNLTTVLGQVQWNNDTVTAEIGTFNTRVLESSEGFTLAPSVGNCTVNPFLQLPPAADAGLAGVTFLDAGPSLSIQGPNGTQTIAKNTSAYGAQPEGSLTSDTGLVGGETLKELLGLETGACPNTTTKCTPFFLSSAFAISQGTYTVTGTGGSAVGALSAPITISQAAASFNWTNKTTITSAPVDRSSPLTITWTGGDQNGFVDITAIASTLTSGIEPPANTPGVLVECIAPASTGSFQIPAYVLQALPSTAGSKATLPPGELLVGPASGAMTVTPVPSGLDALYITYHFLQGVNVNWQ